MSNQEVKEEEIMSRDPEMPDVVMEEAEEGVDGEIDEEIQEMKAVDKGGSASRSGGRDTADESPRKSKSGSDRRRRHHHHHSGSGSGSSHHKRRCSGGHSEEDGEAVEDSGRSRRRSDSVGDDLAPSSSSSSHRRNRDRRSSRSQRSRRRSGAPRDEWQQGESVEEPLTSSRSRRTERDKKGEAEAEDGEILEDGELDDDDGNNGDTAVPHEESANARLSLDTSIEDTEGSPSKPHNNSKEDGKNQKRDRKRQEHRDKRKRGDDKKKRKKYVDVDKMPEDESEAAPAWGSGYQGGRPKSSPHRPPSRSPPHGKSSKNPGGRTKGYQSPPGLYDSPSYSEDSENDQYPPPSLGLLSGGYLDASVAADEKEGVFKRGVTFKKKKRPDRSQLGMGKRRGQDFGKAEGPPKKKALIDIAMSDRPKCKFYRDGKCAKGSGCPFNHDMDQAKRMEVCKYHLTVKGCHKERCLYMHDFPCKYYHTGAQCFSGDRCKFSHDILTQETRRALEMRVAPEDILDMDDPDYESDYDYRQRNYEPRTRPSLLGSPPRRHDVKKIPSLFDIEVHPPAPSPKPSPSSIRPSGFYNEAGSSPPSSGENMGNSRGVAMPNNGGNGNNNISNNNISNNNSMGNMASGVGPVGANNQSGGPGMLRPNMSGNLAGQGLLQTPNLPSGAGSGSMGPMMGGPMGGNRPPLMGNQPMRPGMPFMNNNNNNNSSNNNNNSNPPSNNLPPVLNMLGAIIREAAMQKVSSAASSMNMNGPGMNNMAGMNMGPNNMNNMPPNSMPNVQKNMPPNSMPNVQNMSNMPPNSMPNVQKNMPPNSMPNVQNMSNMPPNSMPNVQNMSNMPPNSMPNVQNMNNMPPISMPNVQNMNNMPQNSMPNVQNMNNMPPNSMPNVQNMNNNMPLNSIPNVQNMNNNMPPNTMPNVVQNTMNNAMNMVQGNMNVMAQNSMNTMGPNNMNRMMQSMNQMGPNNMGPSGASALGANHRGQINPSDANSNILPGRVCDDNAMMPGDIASCGNNDSWEQEDMMDVDYRVKQTFDDGDETSKDLSELDSIRRRLQEQIKQEEGEEEGEEEEEEMEENPAEDETTSQEDQPSKDQSGFNPDQQEAMDDCSKKGSPKAASDSTLDSIEVPAHLPKKQRELFMRIQQQHILREREKERQEALKSSEEADSNVEKDDWYSSSDEEEEVKAKSTESKDGKISESTSGASEGSSSTSAAAKPSFDIMQMINAIRSQVTPAVDSKTSGPPYVAGKPDPRRRVHSVETKSPASPPTSPVHQSPTPPSFPIPVLAAEPPVISATPTKPLKYTIIKIALNMAKTYTSLPVHMDVMNPSYKFDPRVKRHLQLVGKHPRSPVSVTRDKDVRRSSVDGTTAAADKSAKLVDPRLNRTPTDPRLSKMGGGSPSSGRPDEGRPTDPRLKKDPAAARPVDPRLAKRAASAINDPRLNRQISQESGNQVIGGQMNNMSATAPSAGGNFMGNMHPRMGGPMGNMGGMMGNVSGGMNTMGGPMNNMGGPMNNMGGPRNNMGGPMNTMGGPMSNMGGLVNNQMGGVMNNINGPVRPPMQGSGPMNNMNRMGGPMNLVGNSMNNPLNNFGGPMNNMGGNRMPKSMGANSQGTMMGSHGLSLLGGPMNRMGGPSGVSNPMSNQMGGPNERTHASFLEKPNDPRLSQRSLSDPRLNDPRIQNKSQEMQDQGVNRNDPRLISGGQIGRPSNLSDSGFDPRLASDPRRSSDVGRSGPDESLASRSFPSSNFDVSQERNSISSKLTKGIMEPLPSLSSSASLPPLPSLSPPSSFSSTNTSSSVKETQSSLKLSTSEVEKPTKKFDYRNDPRFKRVKRAAAARQSSMEYSSPLGGDEGEMQNAEEPAGSLQYNSYNRPKPTGASSPHRQNAPSPTLPDTLQDFDAPDLPPQTDLKVKDVFKAIDPTASPFC